MVSQVWSRWSGGREQDLFLLLLITESRDGWVGREFKDQIVLTPCPGQGCFAPDQGAPRRVQTASEEFQGWSKVRTQSWPVSFHKHSWSLLPPSEISCEVSWFLVPGLPELGEDGGSCSLKHTLLSKPAAKSPLRIVPYMKDTALVQRLTFILSSARS